MKNFGVRGRKIALTIHLICCGTWLGAAIAMMILITLRGQHFESDELFTSTWIAIKAIDDFVIILSAGVSFLSGCVLSLGTNWGFLKWYWIIVKLVVTTILITFGAFCLGPWINGATAIAGEYGIKAQKMVEFTRLYSLVSIFGTLQVFALMTIFGISVFKPWGKVVRRPTKKTALPKETS